MEVLTEKKLKLRNKIRKEKLTSLLPADDNFISYLDCPGVRSLLEAKTINQPL